MSKSRQRPSIVRSVSIGFEAGHEWREYRSSWGQVVWGSAVLTIRALGRTWVVPPHRVAWIPAGVTHTVTSRGRGTSHRIYVRRGAARPLPKSVETIVLTPLAREIVRRVLHRGVLRGGSLHDASLLRVLIAELAEGVAPTLDLPMPVDPDLREVAERLRTGKGTVTEVARRAGLGVRTLERRMHAQVGMSLGAWCRRARLQRAIEQLGSGASVTAAGLAAGYAGTSAFIAAFRRVMGVTPRAWAQRLR